MERGASKFEDISLGENRPTQLVKRYGNLYSEARLDAMDALDELADMADADTLKVKLLLSIVVVSLSHRLFLLLLLNMKSRYSQTLLACSPVVLPIPYTLLTIPLHWVDFLPCILGYVIRCMLLLLLL